MDAHPFMSYLARITAWITDHLSVNSLFEPLPTSCSVELLCSPSVRIGQARDRQTSGSNSSRTPLDGIEFIFCVKIHNTAPARGSDLETSHDRRYACFWHYHRGIDGDK